MSVPCNGFYQWREKGKMLAICEDCSKKYNIDESKMKGTKARFSCQECGHIIVVVKGGPGREAQATGSGLGVKKSEGL